jgi:hypothetical protein
MFWTRVTPQQQKMRTRSERVIAGCHLSDSEYEDYRAEGNGFVGEFPQRLALDASRLRAQNELKVTVVIDVSKPDEW